MALHDITLPIRPEHPPWPGDPPYRRRQACAIQKGDHSNVSHIALSAHFATHLDAPFHFIDRGITVEALDINTLIGPALVHEVESNDLIHSSDLPNLQGVERIFFKTPNQRYADDTEFHTDYVSLSHEAACALTSAGIRLVGIDYFSIEAYESPGNPVHKELCGKGVIIVEGLDLRNINPGTYELIVLPPKFKDADGSPCRAVLRDF